jgi:transcription elongation GreA/GreB family factor
VTEKQSESEKQSEYLTESQRATLEAELAELDGPRRAQVVQAIKIAREHGDLSENFEYHAAKNEQGLLEAGDEVAVEAPGGAWSARIRSVRRG